MGRIPWNKGLKTGYAPWRGKKRGPQTPQWRARIAKANRKPKTVEHAAHIAAARIGMKHSTYTIKKISRTKLAQRRRMSETEKARLSAQWMGKKNPAWGQTPKHGPRTHWIDYRGMSLRSSYEVRFAKALDAHSVLWEYEPKRFDLGTCTYLPDFYLPESRLYVEVKGWYGPDSRKRVERFRQVHPEIPLLVATNDVITMMEVSSGGWHVEDRLGLAAQQCAVVTA